MAIAETVRALLDAERSRTRLGLVIEDADAARATAVLVVDETMLNGLDVAHGGFIFAMADQAFACAAATISGGVATTSATISFLSAARAGEELRAEAHLVYVGSRRVVGDVTVTTGERTVALLRAEGRLRRGPEERPTGHAA